MGKAAKRVCPECGGLYGAQGLVPHLKRAHGLGSEEARLLYQSAKEPRQPAAEWLAQYRETVEALRWVRTELHHRAGPLTPTERERLEVAVGELGELLRELRGPAE